MVNVEPFRSRTEPNFLFTIFFVILLLLTTSACTTAPKTKDPDITTLENQIQEINKKIDEIYHRVSVIQFMADNHERNLKNIEKGITKNDIKKTVSPEQNTHSGNNEILQKKKIILKQSVPHSEPPEIIYNKALASYKHNNYDKGIVLFNSVVKDHSKHDLADNALYWVGECYYAQKKYSDAISTFQNVLKKYPEGSKIPDSLLKTGYSYLALNDKENARVYLKQVIQNYPFSTAGNKAEETLKRINQ